jgi:uncharacterized repeat protein (TIGR03803 family)
MKVDFRGSPGAVLLLALALFCTCLSVPASAEAKETVEFNFRCGAGGCAPSGNLVSDSQGNLYGTTVSGGNANCNCGTVFELTPNSGGGWTETVLHAFAGGADGATPYGGVILDTAGNLYGVTYQGGTGSCEGTGCGTVFELSYSGSTWTATVIYTFRGGRGGGSPVGGLVLDATGNLYGTTQVGGTGTHGTVFELSPTSQGWSETVLHSFGDTPDDGASPNTKLAMDDLGDLYGTTPGGGSYGGGTVFRLIPTQGGWQETIIWDFPAIYGGVSPNGVIVHGKALYGTMENGGAFNVGVVFQLTPAIGIWKYTEVYDFTGGRDGGEPVAGVVADLHHLYGTTQYGGVYGLGTVFRLTSMGNGNWPEDVLYSFTDSTDGENPYSPLLLGPSGLFGYANNASGGLVYEITAP